MFKRWCAQQKFNNATNLSHVLMDGGVLSVPFDKLNDFHEKYIEAVKSGEKLFVVEQKSDNYNFFVDIDYKDTRPLTIEEIQDICKIICDKVKRHGGKDCLISVSPTKKVGEYTKTGVHLNWPGFVLNQ
jgi:divalent metal cation (Fe/Co/Zn/Cd) transporter